jgi:hypothetical protein
VTDAPDGRFPKVRRKPRSSLQIAIGDAFAVRAPALPAPAARRDSPSRQRGRKPIVAAGRELLARPSAPMVVEGLCRRADLCTSHGEPKITRVSWMRMSRARDGRPAGSRARPPPRDELRRRVRALWVALGARGARASCSSRPDCDAPVHRRDNRTEAVSFQLEGPPRTGWQRPRAREHRGRASAERRVSMQGSVSAWDL